MSSFIIENGNIFCPDCKFHVGTLAISNGVITNSPSQDAEVIDAENLFIIPGLVDIHFHGCAGYDFCDGTPEAFRAIYDYETSQGITTLCPATMTLPEERLTRIMRAAKEFNEFAGINLEGPFISPAKIGAQNPAFIAKPDVDMLRRLQDVSGGLIKIAVVAPEVDGAFSFIEDVKNIADIVSETGIIDKTKGIKNVAQEAGVVERKKYINHAGVKGIIKLALAHTACDYDTAKLAFEAGINHVTHLYNAMNPINHRQPGPIIAALENENVEVELICDGVHVHPAVVRNTLKSFGTDRVIFISDSMEATGMKDGIYQLGGQKVIKTGNKATLEDGITIAGSVTNLMDCVRIAVKKMNIPLEDAVKCASINPGKSIGLDVSIKTGNSVNLVALDKELNLVRVILV